MDAASSPDLKWSADSPLSVFLFYVLGLFVLDVLYLIFASSKISNYKWMRHTISHENLQIWILILGLFVTLRQHLVTISSHFQSILEYYRSVHAIISDAGLSLLIMAPQYLYILACCYMLVILIPFQIWRPAIRRIKAPTLIKHTPSTWWAFEERLIIYLVELRRQRRQGRNLTDVEGAKTAKKEGKVASTLMSQNSESRRIYTLLQLNVMWLIMALIELYMALGYFGIRASSELPISDNVIFNCLLLSGMGWVGTFICGLESMVELSRARQFSIEDREL